jgi:hypothetical protein
MRRISISFDGTIACRPTHRQGLGPFDPVPRGLLELWASEFGPIWCDWCGTTLVGSKGRRSRDLLHPQPREAVTA